MKNIVSHSNITNAASNRLYETYILNPIRMHTEKASALHSIFAPQMPDIVNKIEGHNTV